MSEEVVLVTGVSGYIGAHVAKLLQEEGYKVRGTVRSLSNEAKIEPLKNLVPDAKFPIELVEADLTKEEGWDKAVVECKYVVHTATLKGLECTGLEEATKKFMTACAAAKTIKRVVFTSCSNAVIGEPIPEADKTYTEEDWTDPESTTIDPYTKSKVVAEKAAWDFVKELPDDQKFELAVINPVFVMGPPLIEAQKGATSVSFMTKIVNRELPGLPRVQFPFCDVRDVAKAHVKALTSTEAVNNRHIICTDSFWVKDIALSAAKEFKPQGYNIPTGQLPYFMVWLAGFFNKTLKTNILPRVGKTLSVSNKRMVETLGIEPTALDCTIHDMIYAMVDLGIARKAKKYKQAGSRAEVPAANGDVEEEKKGEEKEEQEEKTDESKETKELEPEDKEKKEDEEIKEDKPEAEVDNKEKEETAKEEKKEETEAEK